MIVSNQISVKITPSTINYWKNKSYQDVFMGNTILVSVQDLPENSNRQIECKCDDCGRTFSQRRYRNLDVCGYCISSKRMKGNKLGNKRQKIVCPDIQLFKKMIYDDNYGKLHIANHFDVTITVINRWLKENDIVLKKYKGLTHFKSDDEEKEFVDKICSLSNQGKTIAEIANDIKLSRQIIRGLIKKHEIKISNKFEQWKHQFENVLSNIELYVQENKTKTLNQISNEHSISIEHLKKAFKDSKINPKIHSYNKSKGELECRDFIRSMGHSCDSYRFDKIYEIDCFVPSKKFGIEYCGEYWHRYDPNQNNKKYHQNKRNYFDEKDIVLMTIFENEWQNKGDIIKSMIRTRLGNANKIHGRKCVVKKIDRHIADDFHMKHHISGKTMSSLNYGLRYDDKLVSVLSIIKSRFDKKYEYEISRFSSILDTVVVGGLSKLFKYFINDVNPDSCMTYSDLRFGEGKSYEKIGFEYVSDTLPNYFYFNRRLGIMENRMKYQKSKLKTMTEYDDKKTEFEIMSDAGYYILFDCGNKKYGWRKTPSI